MTAAAVARFAGLLADRSRATICLSLIDGRAWTAVEVARHVGIAQSTTSEHLTTLIAAGLLVEERQGRHRYVRLADPAIAGVIEDIAAVAGVEKPVGLRQVRAAQRLAAGRTCYDHLAGELGVSIREALVRRHLLDGSGVTDAGRQWFSATLGPNALPPHSNRPLVRDCLDWTSRVPHLGGLLGAALCTHLFDRDWIIRPHGDRAVELTSVGRRELRALLGAPA